MIKLMYLRHRQQHGHLGERAEGARVPIQQDAQSGRFDYGVLCSASGDEGGEQTSV